MKDQAIQEVAGHVTGAAASVERLAVEMMAMLREGRLFHPDRETWRYLFAGMAMQGMKANPSRDSDYYGFSVESVRQADSLLTELEREEPGDG